MLWKGQIVIKKLLAVVGLTLVLVTAAPVAASAHTNQPDCWPTTCW
jgi:hypothetical protein